MIGSNPRPIGQPLPAALRANVRRKLLRWYDRHKRDLPWRRRRENAYAQCVAEIMLQQTRVDTVLAYYERFLRRFPTLDALAAADLEDVLKHWEGLGYYRRVLHFHQAAQMICNDGGVIPATAAHLQRLPGFGAYSAAAVASIAFQERVAAVDGNVARVVARLFGLQEDVLSTTGRACVREIASQLTPRKRPGDFNQAWMDLGSALCTPKSPDCPQCPLVSLCVAAGSGTADALPRRGGAHKDHHVEVAMVVAVLVNQGRILVRRRPTQNPSLGGGPCADIRPANGQTRTRGLWTGLWEFPSTEWNGHTAPSRCVHRLARECRMSVVARPKSIGDVCRKLTHRRLTFRVYVVNVAPEAGELTSATSVRWVTARGFRRLAVSTAHRRIFAAAHSEIVERMP